jgi:hypothetical protein
MDINQKQRIKPNKISVKSVSPRAIVAVNALVANGGSKADALRVAGFSEAVARNPNKVFDSEGVQLMMREKGLSPELVANRLKRRMDYKRVHSVEYPLHVDDVPIDPKTDKPKWETSSLTDGQLIEIMESGQSKVLNIEYRNEKRVIWLQSPNVAVETDTINKLIAIYGMEAPRKIEGKMENTHNFSLTDLRRKAEEVNYEVLNPTKIIDVQ